MNEHYNSIAVNFDENWSFSSEYINWMTNNIIDFLQFNSSDIFADIGAGTGLYTNIINEKILFNNPILFIEPSYDMTKSIEHNNKYNIFNETSDIFLDRNISFDKILFKEVIHHISDRNSLWKKLYKNLNINGIFLVITRPQNIKIPLFSKAKDAFKINQPNYNIFIEEAKNAGFEIDINIKSFNFSLEKERWFKMLRDRFMSDLTTFTDKEIEEGIYELEKSILSNMVDIEDEIIFLIGIKTK